jgi:hypothetical protein
MLSMASLEIDPRTPEGYSTTTADRPNGLVERAAGTAVSPPSPAVASARRTPCSRSPRGIDPRIADFPERRPENLLCDPANADQLAAYLGVPPRKLSPGRTGPSERGNTPRALVAVLDDPNASVAYLESEANDPAAFNRAAVHRPCISSRACPLKIHRKCVFGSITSTPRAISPAASRSSMKSWDPTAGATASRRIGADLPALHALGNGCDAHDGPRLPRQPFVAEPVSPSDYRSGTVAVAYGSGGRILMRDERTYEPAP